MRAHNPNGISIGSAVFAQMTAECPYTLQWDAPFPHQNCPLPNGISIGSAIFALLTSVTDRPTDRPTNHTTRSVTISRMYVVQAMWSNNV